MRTTACSTASRPRSTPAALAIVVRDPDVRGVFPVRAAIPAAVDPGAATTARRRRWAAAGRRRSPGSRAQASRLRSSTRVSTSSTPTSALRSCAGSTCSIPAGTRVRVRTRPRPAGRSATAPRWRASSSGRAARPVSRASPRGASLLPIRVAGWQPDTTGGVSVYGRTDQLLAGIELAVDPNEDGDAHDAARVALVGVVEPFAAFTDGPLAAAAAGATALDSLVVAAAGNDGPAGPAYGSVGGPGGAPAALTAGAIDTQAPEPDRARAPARRAPRRSSPAISRSAESSLRRCRSRPRSWRSPGPPRPSSVRPAASPASSTRRRLQPRRRRGRAPPARYVVAGGRARGRHRRCARRARRRPAAGRARSAPTARSRFRSWGCPPTTQMPSGRRFAGRSRSRSPSAQRRSTRTTVAARRRRSRPRGSRSTAARSPT